MEIALQLADWAAYWGEVPVGAVVLDAQRRIIGMGVNQTIYHHDPTQHAELVALRQACAFMGNYRLPAAQLIVTLEPCMRSEERRVGKGSRARGCTSDK